VSITGKAATMQATKKRKKKMMTMTTLQYRPIYRLADVD
jgi:hypothetical protein